MKNRSGFTLVELLIVAVLGALVVAAAYQVLLVNQRTYTEQNAQIQAQQTTRAGMDVLFGELREISRAGGDVIAFASDSLRIRAGRNFGLVCAADVTNGTMDVRRVGGWFADDDSVVVYAENQVNTAADDDWIIGRITARDTTVACGGAQAQRITVPQITTAAAAADTVRVGAPVRSFTHYTYGLYTLDGEPYLGRREGSTSAVPLVGPLRTTNGIAFRYLDTLGTVTTTATNIAQIEVTLRTLSSARGADGAQVADSVTTRIYVRN